MNRGIKLSFAAFCVLVMISSIQANAQNMYDAYRYSQQYWEGTARSVAMGNAVVALGGDMGAIPINPAASGVYRYSELVFTPALTNMNSKVNYLGNSTSDNKTRFGIANFGYVGSFQTGRTNSGLINWNIGVIFNKANNFTSRMSASGRTNQSSWLSSLAQNTNGIHATSLDINDKYDPYYQGLPWNSILGWNTSLLDTLPDSGFDYRGATENLDPVNMGIGVGGDLDQHFTRESIGSVSEVTINLGGNISNKLFFGFNLGIQSIWYKYSEIYSETAVNSNNFQTGFEHFSHTYNTKTSGTGVNLKFGLIYLPFKGLRLGASISTPTWMFLYNESDESMSSRFNDGYNQSLISPLSAFNYRVNTPFRWNVGAAYTLGNIGALSVDYERVNYSQMKMKDDNNNAGEFAEDNRAIKDYFTNSNILRAGMEIKLLPEVALRAGYQYYTSGEMDLEKNKAMTTTQQYGSVGLGYISRSGFFADIAYQQQLQKTSEKFWLYDDIYDGNGNVYRPAPEGINKFGNFKILLSIGFRF